MRRSTLSFMLSVVASFMLLIGASAPAAALENAFGYAYDANTATYAAIEAGYPAIRDGNTFLYNFQYMRTGNQKIINGNTLYVEIGWWKAGSSGNNLFYYWTYRNTNLNTDYGYGSGPGCCNGYNYQVENFGGGNWALYYNALDVPVVAVNTGYDSADDWFSGGETSSASNAMGVSGNYNVAYKQNGTWLGAGHWQPFITNSEYYVNPYANDTSWQVYGNN